MIKVKLKHAFTETDKVYRILTENAIEIRGTDLFGDVTTCIFSDNDEIRRVLNELNRCCYFGVSIIYKRELFDFKSLLDKLIHLWNKFTYREE